MKTVSYKRKEVMKMAWQFVKSNGFTLSEALVQAWRNIKLRFKMYDGVVKFTFIKKDGSLREAEGTLCERMMPTIGGSRKSNNTVQVYFDCEKNEFRCFKLTNLLSA